MTADDAQLLYELDQDPAVMKYINGGKMTSMETIQETFIPRMQSFTQEDKGWGLWKVTVTESNQFIGWILVRPMEYFTESPELHNLELGWRFKQSTWGKGFATEAAQAIADELKKQDDIKQLTAVAMVGNEASVSIMKKLGMEYVKTYLHQDPLGDVEAVYYTQYINQ